MNINNELDKLSHHMHNRTGYSIRHVVIESKREIEQKYRHDFFIFSSDEYSIFIELINEACK